MLQNGYLRWLQDGPHGNWWLIVEDIELGYWPKPIIPNLYEGAKALEWGGEIVNKRISGHHTLTQMGSGHFSSEGFGKASFFRDINVITDIAHRWKQPDKLNTFVSNSKCYDIEIPDESTVVDTEFYHGTRFYYGTQFYYGGPGFSKDCP